MKRIGVIPALLMSVGIVYGKVVNAPKVEPPTLIISHREHYGSPESGRVGMRREATNPGKRELKNVLAVVV